MKGKKYIPQAFRSIPNNNPAKGVKMPKREVLTKDRELIQYYKEIFILYVDLAINASEKVLDSEIDIMERIHLQKTQNDLFHINEIVKSGLRDQVKENHENRVDFVAEMVALCTLIHPKYFHKVQSDMVKTIEKLARFKK